MSFRTKKSLDMYCKSSYILLVVAACAVASGGEESSATVGKTKVVSTTGLGTTSNLQRTGSGGLGSSSQLQRTSSLGSGSLSSTGTGNATVGSTGRLSISSVGSGVSQQSGLVGIDPSSGLPTGKVQHKYGVSASDFNVLEVPGGINPGERYVQFTNTKGELVTYREGLSTKLKLLWNESEIGRDYYIGTDGKVHSYIYRSKPRWVSGSDILDAQGGDGGSSSLPQQQGNISSSVIGLGNKSVGTQTDTGNLGGLGTPKKDTSTSSTKKFTSQLNLNFDKDGNITKQNKGTNTGDGAGAGTSDGISKTQLNVNGDGKVVSRSIGTNTGTPGGVSETELNINGSGKVTTRSVGTNTEGVGETTSVVTPLGGDKDFSDSSTQTLISGSGVQPKKRTNKGVGTQTDPAITGEGGLTSLVAKSDGSQTSSGDGNSIPVKSVVYNFEKMPHFVPKGSESDTVKSSTETQTSSGDGDGASTSIKSVVYNFGKMPKFTAKGNESDIVKPSTSVGTDVASGGEKTTKPLTDTGSGGGEKTYTSTLKINIGGKGQQSTGGDDKQPQNKYLADMANRLGSLLLRKDVDKNGNIVTTDYTKSILGTGQPEVVSIKPASGNRGASGSGASSSLGQQSSSSQTGGGAVAQGGSGSSTSGKGVSSSGQQGQGSSSQQSASGSGAQGGSGDGSGGKKTPSSPVSGQTTSSSAQIEVKDEEGKTHQAVLVNTKGTSGGGASKKPGLSTIIEEGESSQAIGEQDKKSSSTQTKDSLYRAVLVEVDEEGEISQVIGQQGKGSLVQTQTGDDKKYSAIFVTLDEKGNIVQTSGQQGQKSSSSQTGSGAGAQGSSGSLTSGKGTSSSGQQGQGSSSQQSASGSGAQGGSGDGSGGKKTPPSGQQGGEDKGIFVSEKDAAKFKPTYVGKSLEELKNMTSEELRNYALNRDYKADFKNVDLSAAKGLNDNELDEFMKTNPVITYELDLNGRTIVEVNNTPYLLGKGYKLTRKTIDKLPSGRYVESVWIDKFAGYDQRIDKSTTSTGAVSQGGNTTGTVPSGQTAQFETSGGAGAQGASGASTAGSKASSSLSGKKGTEGSGNKPMYVGTPLKNLEGLSEEELINHAKNTPAIDWDNVKSVLPKAATQEEAKDLAKKNPVVSYEVDDLGDLVEVNNSKWLYGVGERVVTKVLSEEGKWLEVKSLGVKFIPYSKTQKGDSKGSSTGSKVSTSGSGAQGSGGASQKEGSDSSSKTGNQGGSKVGTSLVGDTSQTSTSGKAGTQASSEVNKGGSKTSSTLVEKQKQWEGSDKVNFDEVRKSLKPVSGTTTGKETGTSDVIDLNETKKNLRPVSGTTTGKETETSGGIDLNEAKKNLRPVSGTTTKEGSEKVSLNDILKAKANLKPVPETNKQKETSTGVINPTDLIEARKQLKPIPVTSGEKGTGASGGANFDESKKSSTPVSGGGSGTQGTDGDNTGGKKTTLPLTGNDGQGSDGVKESLGANAGDGKIRYAYVGKKLEDLKVLTQQQLIDRADEINDIDVTNIKFNRPSGNTQEEIDDFLANNFIISYNFDEDGNIVRTDWTQRYLNRGPVLTTHKYVREQNGSFKKVKYETEFKPYRSSDASYTGTGTVPQGETAEFVTTGGKIGQATSQTVAGKQTQGSVDSGTSGGGQKPTVTFLGYSLNDLKNLTPEQVIDRANEINSVDFTKVNLKVPQFKNEEEAKDFVKKNPILSIGIDKNGEVVTVNHNLKYLGLGQAATIEKHKRNSDGSFTSQKVLEVFEPYVKTSTSSGDKTTGTVSTGTTAQVVTSVVKGETASSEVVAGKKSSASLLSKKTQQGTSTGTEVEQVKTSLKKVSIVTEEKASTSSEIDFDDTKKSSQQDLKTGEDNQKGGGFESELQQARSGLKKVPIGSGMYGDAGNDVNVDDYILLGKSTGTRKEIDIKKPATSDENLGNSQGQGGQVSTAAEFFKLANEEENKIGVSNQRGSTFVNTGTNEEGKVEISSTKVDVQNLEKAEPLVLDPGFAKILAKNIQDGFDKKTQGKESKKSS